MNPGQSAVRQWTNDQWGDEVAISRRDDTPRESRFRYGYICRLIDDSELASVPEPLRSRTRSFHKASYWKTLSLLRRDAEHVLRVRREKMATQRDWDFSMLVNDYARIQMLLAKLTLAGMSHSLHLGTGLEAARQACTEFQLFLSPGSLAPALTT